jgi:hypothetical protein
MEGRIARFAHRTVDKATHLNPQEKNNLSDNLLVIAAFIFLCAVPGLSNLGGYVALSTAALTATTGAVVRLR